MPPTARSGSRPRARSRCAAAMASPTSAPRSVEPIDRAPHARAHARLDPFAEGLLRRRPPAGPRSRPRAPACSRAAARRGSSRPSGPCRRSSRAAIAASRTLRVNVPTVSSEDANAIRPYRLTSPYVGFSPTTPHRDAGWRTEPPVSVPSAHTAIARRDGGRAPAARPARDGLEVPRVVHRPERRVLVRGAHRELVAVRLAEQDAPVGPQPSPRRCSRTAARRSRGSSSRTWSGRRGSRARPSSASGMPAPRRRVARRDPTVGVRAPARRRGRRCA